MSGFAVVAVGDRSFTSRGVGSTVELRAEPRPVIRHLVGVIGEGSADLVVGREAVGRFWARASVNAVGTFVCVVVLSLVFLALAPVVVGYRPVVVASGSMAPALRTTDVVVTQSPGDELAVGSVIDFRVGGERRIHRVVEVADGGYRTKGDANPTADSDLVASADVHGVGVMVVPFVGVPSVWFDQGRWAHLAVLAATFVAAAWVTPRRWLFAGPETGAM